MRPLPYGNHQSARLNTLGRLAFLWGILGVTALIGSAVVRLGKLALEAFTDYTLTPLHWGIAVVWLIFMVLSEGYRGFQKKFAPRVAARARYLAHQPRWHWVLLAPLFCMGYFHATRKRKIIAYTVTCLIIGMVLLIRQLDQPWRGIIDLGVVAGLAWGLVSLWIFSFQAFFYSQYPYSPETPDQV